MTDGSRFKDVDEALADLQGALPVIKKATTGNVGGRATKYADLADICKAILPLTSDRGLAWLTRPTMVIREDGAREFVLQYSLRHAPSGTSHDGEYPLGTGNPQQLGSAITYARRYTFCAVTGAVADEDDDGTAASQEPAAKRTREKAPPRPAGELPRNTDGSVSRSRTTDAELAATGQMTDQQLRDHNRLEREVKGTGPQGTQRLTTTPPDDLWYQEPPPRGDAQGWESSADPGDPVTVATVSHGRQSALAGDRSPESGSLSPRPTGETLASATAGQATVRQPRASNVAGVIHGEFKRLGFDDKPREARLGVMTAITGRTITSTNDLSAAEGLAVKRLIQACRDEGVLAAKLLDLQQETPDA